VKRAENQSSLRRLAVGLSRFGWFDTVVDRIADQMDQWILDRLDDGLVELRLVA
jgi:hypothetical protein